MCDKTTCVTAGMLGIYAVRFHHLAQMPVHMAAGLGGPRALEQDL